MIVYLNIKIKQLRAKLIYTCILLPSFVSAVDNLTINNIDQYLVEKERKYHDLIPGTEQTVRWSNGIQQKTEFSILYIHGFSASRQDLSPLTEKLADLINANVFYARLSGHGRSEQALGEVTSNDWIDDTTQAYKVAQLIGEKVIIISSSTGGTLATWLQAQAFADKIIANVMLSPNFGIKRKSVEIVRWPLGLKLAELINGSDYHSFDTLNERHKLLWTERYPMKALVPVVKLVDQIRDLDKSTTTVPQLIIYSKDDQVISVDAVLDTAAEFKNAKVKLIDYQSSSDPSQHVLVGDACGPESTDDVVSIIHNYLEPIMLQGPTNDSTTAD